VRAFLVIVVVVVYCDYCGDYFTCIDIQGGPKLHIFKSPCLCNRSRQNEMDLKQNVHRIQENKIQVQFLPRDAMLARY